MTQPNRDVAGSSLPPINFKALAAELLARAHQLLPMWLPGGRFHGAEYLVHSYWRAEKTASLSIRVSGDDAGAWGDFGGDHRGRDLLSLYAAIHGLDMGKAAVQAANEYGLHAVAGIVSGAGGNQVAVPVPAPVKQPARPPAEEGWAVVRPVPGIAPSPTFKHTHRAAQDIEHIAEYRRDDELHGYVVRFKKSDGGKDPLPYTWCTSARDGASRWHWKHFNEPRPLYFPNGKAPTKGQTVILVEGELKAAVLQALLDAHTPGVYVVASWPSGCKAWKKADWSWLAGCTVLLWPDCDSKRVPLTTKERNACKDEATVILHEQAKPYLPRHEQPGMAAMLCIGALLRDEHGAAVSLLAIDDPGIKPDGWDCADAIRSDAWTHEQVLAFFATAYALPAKIDGPAAAGGGEPAAPQGAGASGGGGGSQGGGLELPDWLRCYYDAAKGRWMVSRKLVITCLRNDPELVSVLGFNELSNNIEARRPWPFTPGDAGPVKSSTDLLLGDWLSSKYGMPAISRQALVEAIETVAHESPWHPVKDWLYAQPWDKKSRIDKWLLWVLGEDPENLSKDMHEYLTLIGRYWLLGMVNRVMEPGCKFDYCPVLEGKGGLGKSTFIETLVGSDWYSDTKFDMDKGHEAQEQVQGIWGYELGELSQVAKAALESIKSFISAKKDRYRPAYGRVVEAYPRQCVLMGTTNHKTYLRDRTGNRRFWPIPVRNKPKIEWLRKWRGQLFAEALALYQEGTRYYPTQEEEDRLFVPMQESRIMETAITSELLSVLTRPPAPSGMGAYVNNLTEFVTLAQLVAALNVDAGKSNAGTESQVRDWMNHQGWEYKKKQINGARAYGWIRPSNWPDASDTGEAPDMAAPQADALHLEDIPDDVPF